MGKANHHRLQLTIISAEALSLTGKRPVKRNAFVVIRVDDDINGDQATTIDTQNGSYPSWNEKFVVNMPTYVKFFTLEVRCRDFSGDHLVGSARVPTSDFVSNYFPSDYLQFLSYRLRDRYGDRNGIINISIKMEKSGGSSSNEALAVTGSGWKQSQKVVMGVPVQHY